MAVILNALRASRIAPLRSSRHRLSATESCRLQAEHEAMAPVLDHLRFATEAIVRLHFVQEEEIYDALS